MTEPTPQAFATGLSAKLAASSRHVCLFLGAGIAKACGLPDVKSLEARVQADIEEEHQEAFRQQLKGRNIEQVLSRLRRIAGLIEGADEIDGLTSLQAEALDSAVCQAIVRALDLSSADLKPVCNLAAWAARANYRQAIELFTVNYDLLLETALESIGVPYFDGFVGNLQAQFRTELVESSPGGDGTYLPASFVRLWKLHGSVNWVRQGNQGIVRIGRPIPEGLPSAIYPSDAKYDESRRVPFVVLQDRLRRALHQPETLTLIVGYSFGDAHLNEMIFDAATRRERSEFVVFCFSDITDELRDRASRTPNIQVIGSSEAILGGTAATWKVPDSEIPDIWVNGKMALPDFTHLASYLARSSTRHSQGSYGFLQETLREETEKSAESDA